MAKLLFEEDAVSSECETIVGMENLAFSYDSVQTLLNIRSFRLHKGRHQFLTGPSGSGKSTFLGLVAGILEPDYGALHVLGKRLDQMPRGARDVFRGEHIGYIFQTFNLIPYLTVRENIVLPCRMNANRRRRVQEPAAAAEELADCMGIGDILEQRANSISVGQAQRTAAARALIGSPELIIADEPTSALDEEHGRKFIQILFNAAELGGSTILFVSHDDRMARHFPVTVRLKDLNYAYKKKGGKRHALARTHA